VQACGPRRLKEDNCHYLNEMSSIVLGIRILRSQLVAIWGGLGGMAMLKEVCHCWQALTVQRLPPFLIRSVLSV
jgi:repressor of nif and glnA expression